MVTSIVQREDVLNQNQNQTRSQIWFRSVPGPEIESCQCLANPTGVCCTGGSLRVAVRGLGTKEGVLAKSSKVVAGSEMVRGSRARRVKFQLSSLVFRVEIGAQSTHIGGS